VLDVALEYVVPANGWMLMMGGYALTEDFDEKSGG